ncbi:AfsR/SARP family transcriptional regulator [Micromonospora cathayae]|uniref:BTAD domain-containing putative transcriptional regulator n=1 Tax=Micromonospora cathayae TaxID=3028804 RepID=A0ABY7ZVU0_9ACTN|nr:BTAD domain-containing putative transcriptional regulator [Micromonospora sp. HUAS 3]WDZ86232.1 BTAD domain-containing putative transcriptional regulator [Micromonospora sp. HUAS 3]
MTGPFTGLWCGVLGPLLTRVGDHPVPVSGRRQRAFLAALALTPGVSLPLDALAARVWPEQAAPGHAGLPVLAHRVRRRLAVGGPAAARAVRRTPDGYLLDLAVGGSDVLGVRDALRRARSAAREGDSHLVTEITGHGLVLVRGTPGQGIWDDPLRWAEVSTITEELLALRRLSLLARLDVGEHVTVLPDLTALARAEPTTEWVHELLMRALYGAGRHAEAIAAYVAFRETVVRELGLEPGPAMDHTLMLVLDRHPRPGAVTAHPEAPRSGRVPVASGPGQAALEAVAVRPLADGRSGADADPAGHQLRSPLTALHRAGAFARAHGGFDEAADCYRGILELTDEPSTRAEALLRLGEALYHKSGQGRAELAHAELLFQRLGQEHRAAEARSWQARVEWLAPTDGRSASERALSVLDLVDAGRPDEAGANALVNICGILAVTDRHTHAERAGQLGLRWARRLSLATLVLRARANLAILSIEAGRPDVITELVDVAREHQSRLGWVPSSLYVTLADGADRLGRLDRAAAQRRLARRSATRTASPVDLEWLAAEHVREEYHGGRLRPAERAAHEYLAGPGGRHRMASEVHVLLARIALAGRGLRTAQRHARSAEAMARRDGGWSLLGPALVVQTRVAFATGRPRRRTAPLVEELLHVIAGRTLTSSFGADLPLALREAGLRRADLTGLSPADSPWWRAAESALSGDPGTAREAYRRLGSRPDAWRIVAADS